MLIIGIVIGILFMLLCIFCVVLGITIERQKHSDIGED